MWLTFLGRSDPAQFSDNPFGFAEVCNKQLRVKSSDNTSKIITVTVKDQYLGFRDADDIVLMQAAFNAIVNQHEETELSGGVPRLCLAIPTEY